ncbi:MAG: heme o synthase [Pseudomonadales bacterium]|nr:heme o synthase [Pseudomonadales bacterium]
MPSASPSFNTLSDYVALMKLRLLSLVLVSTAMGYYLAARTQGSMTVFLYTLLGVACVGSGANALNQWYERHIDSLMRRTKMRPLPARRLGKTRALIFGIVISVMGFLVLGYQVNTLTLLLSFASWASYLFIYTPLKSRTVLNTWVGAVPGALPAVLGCTAVTGSLSPEALSLFLILYFWQMPHFFAISWVYREDYLLGGFKMLSHNDPDGRKTSRQIMIHSVLLFLASLLLFILSDSSFVYLFSALIAGGIFLYFALAFYQTVSTAKARHVFQASIIYLPFLFLAIIVDRMVF